jgi:hypothetical protein
MTMPESGGGTKVKKAAPRLTQKIREGRKKAAAPNTIQLNIQADLL